MKIVFSASPRLCGEKQSQLMFRAFAYFRAGIEMEDSHQILTAKGAKAQRTK
jgi:hypothetical protein